MEATIDRIMGRVREVIEEELESLRGSLKEELIAMLRGDAPLPKARKAKAEKPGRKTKKVTAHRGKTKELIELLEAGPVTVEQIKALGYDAPQKTICNLRGRDGLKITLDRRAGTYTLES